MPGDIGGYTEERIIRAPADGLFEPLAAIGDRVEEGAPVARVAGAVVCARLTGVVRGMLPAGLAVNLVLALLALACTAVALVGILTIRHPRQLLLISGAGVLFAFCATNMHVVSSHIVATGFVEGLASLPWLNAIALAASGLVGSWLVQSSYSAGPPEMVIAGLTVIDPIIAVVLGATLLGEAADAAVLPLLGMALFGVLACAAVVVLSKHHPDAVEAEARRSHRKHGPAPGAGTDDEVPDPARR